MKIDLEKQDLKKGLLGLVMALVEVIRDALEHQAVRRMEGESLSPEQLERLGQALMELNHAIKKIKDENQLDDVVLQVHDELGTLVSEVLNVTLAPGAEKIGGKAKERKAS